MRCFGLRAQVFRWIRAPVGAEGTIGGALLGLAVGDAAVKFSLPGTFEPDLEVGLFGRLPIDQTEPSHAIR
jgi:hypothetical protein